MNLIHVTISVSDLEQSLRFYNELVGLPIKRRFASPGTEIVFLGDGGADIELIHHENNGALSIGKDISIGFAVESVEAKLAELRAAGVEATNIISPNPHVRFFFVSDPSGVRIQFVESLGA